MKKTRTFIFALLLVIAIVAIGFAVYYYQQYQAASLTQSADAEVTMYVNKVGALMKLPNEKPSVSKITDKTQLTDQEFLKQAENGDVVLVFMDAKKAVMYRPSENKIVDVAPVYIQASPTPNASGSTPAVSPAPKA